MMNEEQKKKPISLFNLVLWLGGTFYLGWMIRQLIINIFGIELDSAWYSENYALVQLVTYLPFGLILGKATKARFTTVISALLTIFSLYLMSTSADMVAQLDNAWEYFQENKADMIEYFTNQVIWLLPILIGFVFTELVRILSPMLLKIEFVANIVTKIVEGMKWISDFWKDKLHRLTSKPVVKEVVKKESKQEELPLKTETKKEVKKDMKKFDNYKKTAKKKTGKK